MYRDFLWLTANDLLINELSQLQDEGTEIPPQLEARLRELAGRGEVFLATEAGQQAAGALLDETIALPIRRDYPFQEPSELAAIRSLRPPAPPLPTFSDDLSDRLLGAWLGRVYGCYLGKPVEGLRRRAGETFLLEGFLKETGQWPLAGYFSLDYPEALLKSYGLNLTWRAGPSFMPEDDDTNYTTVAFALLRDKGVAFSSGDIAAFWLDNLPIGRTYTAERVAYRNLANNLTPPQSAVYRNVYREWIGAQIRGDFFGYVAPGDPERAAEFAWRDAAVSHVKNGIYGEMWVAAMLAAAYLLDDPMAIIQAGLAQIPARCRLAAALADVLAWHAQGLTYADAVRALHHRWDEHNSYHWCHTISNAQICAAALLWGGGDYVKSISYAVLPGFDTDCNAATVGSIVGLMHGVQALPTSLTARLNDRLQTGVQGFLDCSIRDMAHRMAQVVEKFNS